MEMTNLEDHHQSAFKIERAVFNTGLEDELFKSQRIESVPLEFKGSDPAQPLKPGPLQTAGTGAGAK